ncbi:hypothetical protein ACIGW3_14275 [Streptomyces sp. NPDC053499]|uniref:hypothetical protein n=1 Tax=Streptomyces sp. NPDC053499 TaxID=3365707 RepID=UPI0037CFA143
MWASPGSSGLSNPSRTMVWPPSWLSHMAGLTGPEADAGPVRVALDWATGLLREELQFTWWYDGDPQVIAAWLPTQRARIAAFSVRHPRCKTAADALIAVGRLRTAAIARGCTRTA